MKRLDIASAKPVVVFPEGKLPAKNSANLAFVRILGKFETHSKVKAKAAQERAPIHPLGQLGLRLLKGGIPQRRYDQATWDPPASRHSWDAPCRFVGCSLSKAFRKTRSACSASSF
jgi:hypothetical protein